MTEPRTPQDALKRSMERLQAQRAALRDLSRQIAEDRETMVRELAESRQEQQE